jgi:hypothetical protein
MNGNIYKGGLCMQAIYISDIIINDIASQP